MTWSAIETGPEFLEGGKEFADFDFGVFVVLVDGKLEGFLEFCFGFVVLL